MLKTVTKTPVHSKVMSIYLMQRPFAVHELLPLFFKRFSTTMHYSKMSQMTVTFIDIFQILKITRENPVLQYNFHKVVEIL